MPRGLRLGSRSCPSQSSPHEKAVDHSTRRIGALVGHGMWILTLVVLYTVNIGRHGFSPTDQGVILAQSWRILGGEVPHRDIVSARPLGSAYLHTVDILAPGPLFLWSIAIAALQMVLMTVALASWISEPFPVTVLLARCSCGAVVLVVEQDADGGDEALDLIEGQRDQLRRRRPGGQRDRRSGGRGRRDAPVRRPWPSPNHRPTPA